MKQNFKKDIHKKFVISLDIKKSESQIELDFYKKTEKYLKLIKWLPGLSMVGIGNSISMNSATESSDIDLYIVTKKNRIWICRIFITFIFQILGVRKNSKKHAGRFCLSFFSTKDGMDFSKFNIKNDIYLYFWILYFKPILSYDNTYELFLEKNESWANFSDYLDILEKNKNYIKYKKNTEKKLKITKKFLDILEKIFKKFFLTKTLKTYEKMGKPFGIIINDDLLKFHNKDIRKKISKKFK